jgi:hypothetical protein
VFSTAVIFIWTTAATLFRSSTVVAFLLLPWMAVFFLNALQHLYWTFLFRSYAPGVITAVLVIIPTVAYLTDRSLRQRLVPVWFILLLGIVVLLGVIQTVTTGNVMTGPFREVHEFFIALSKMLFG